MLGAGHISILRKIHSDQTGRAPRAIWTVEKLELANTEYQITASQISFLYTLFTINRQSKEGNKLFSSLLWSKTNKQTKNPLQGFSGASEKSFIIVKLKTWVLILPLKPNKKHDIGPSLPRVWNGSEDGNMARDLEDWAFIPHTLLTNHSMEWVLREPRPACCPGAAGVGATCCNMSPLVPWTSCVPRGLSGAAAQDSSGCCPASVSWARYVFREKGKLSLV